MSLCKSSLEMILAERKIATLQRSIIEASLRFLGVNAQEARKIADEVCQLELWNQLVFPDLAPVIMVE